MGPLVSCPESESFIWPPAVRLRASGSLSLLYYRVKQKLSSMANSECMKRGEMWRRIPPSQQLRGKMAPLCVTTWRHYHTRLFDFKALKRGVFFWNLIFNNRRGCRRKARDVDWATFTFMQSRKKMQRHDWFDRNQEWEKCLMLRRPPRKKSILTQQYNVLITCSWIKLAFSVARWRLNYAKVSTGLWPHQQWDVVGMERFKKTTPLMITNENDD